MSKVVTVVYEDGVLRPLDPLDLHDHQTVRIQILADEPNGDPGQEAIRILVAAGLMRLPERTATPPDPVPEKERRALAEGLGRAPGKLLSEIIVEDRGEW